jgi:hypothetical protein
MDRRTFLNVAAGTGAASALGAGGDSAPRPASKGRRLRGLERPAAIAMWDFSWLLRHHPLGSFEDWDRTLDELCERGYDAIRMDVFPALVAGPGGEPQDCYYFPKNNWKPAMWGNQYSVRVDPRRGLREFLPKCAERGVGVGMSTWFFGPGVGDVEGLDGFVRVWDETLRFIEQLDMLDACLYVDLLNEYPLFHGFSWFTEKLAAVGERGGQEQDEREAHQWSEDMGQYNAAQVSYYRDFMTQAVKRLRARWPDLDFFASMTYNQSAPWRNMDCSEFDALEVHYWANLNGLLPKDTGYWSNIHNLAENDQDFPEVQRGLMTNWRAHKQAITDWLDAELAGVAAKARELGVPCGNTEGWGLINWLDHPALTWDIIKEAGLIGADLGRKHGFLYNCSSNFTHPHFGRLWDDVTWHQEVTSVIRGL